MRYLRKPHKILLSSLLVLSVMTPDVYALELSKEQAIASVAPQSLAKVPAEFRQRIFDQPSSELIIEFVSNTSRLTGSDSEESLKAAEIEIAKTKKEVLSELSAGDYQKLKDYETLPMSFVHVKSRDALVKILNNPKVKKVYENKINKPFLSSSLPFIGQDDAYSAGFGGAGTTVVILDTGIDYTHPAFGSCTKPGNPESCRVVAAFDAAKNDGSLDDDDHGTNVSGIVAGVGPDNRVATIDVFTRFSDGLGAFDSDILQGISWAIKNQKKYNIVAINMSLGASIENTTECTDSAYTTPFSMARAVNILPVVASGNDGFTNGVATPACTPGAVRVGAVYDGNISGINYGDCSDATTAADKVTCFTNSGDLLTLFAPGAQITAAGITQFGTSQATPHVAGAISVLRGTTAVPNATATQVLERLTANGTPVIDSRNQIEKPRLNLLSAVSNIPDAPSDLTASPASPTGINLNWSDNTSNETGFAIERKTKSAKTWTLVHTTSFDDTEFTDTGLKTNASYVYRVYAVIADGNSNFSNEFNIKLSKPASPSKLVATVDSSSEISLSWTDKGDNETAFKVERKTGSEPWTEITVLMANATSYSDTGLSGMTKYLYRVRAANAVGDSGYSNTVNATTTSGDFGN